MKLRPPWLDLLWHRYIPRPTTCRHSHTTGGQRPHRVFVRALLWWVHDVMWYANSFTNLFFTCKCPTFPRSLFTLALRSSMKHTIYSKYIIDIWTAQPYLFSNKMYKLCMDMHKFQDLNAPFQTYSLNTFFICCCTYSGFLMKYSYSGQWSVMSLSIMLRSISEAFRS